MITEVYYYIKSTQLQRNVQYFLSEIAVNSYRQEVEANSRMRSTNRVTGTDRVVTMHT